MTTTATMEKKNPMKSLAVLGPVLIGALLLLYIFTMGAIWSNHSVQSYMVLCTGVLSINLGLLASALTQGKK